MAPVHSVAQVVQAYFLAPLHSAELGHSDFTLESIHDGHGHQGPASRGLVVVHRSAVGIVVIEEADPLCRPRRRLHLNWKVGPRVDGVGFAKRIGQFLHVNLTQHGTNAHLGVPLGIVDKNELGALRFRQVVEQAVLALVVFRFRRGRGDGGMTSSTVAVKRLHAVVERRRHRSADRVVAWIVRVAVENLRLSDVAG